MKPKMAREGHLIFRASADVIGKKVFNLQGEDVGKIEELVIDARTTKLSYAIMSFGGFLGLGDKLFAVPWVSLNYDPENERFVMKADKELLKRAPGFEKDDWPDLSDPTRLAEIYRYYGVNYEGDSGQQAKSWGA